MRELSRVIYEAAGATSLEEIAAQAFPALARALGGCPSFFSVSARDFLESRAIAGEQRAELAGYLRQYVEEDPLIAAAVSDPRPVNLLERHVDRRVIHASRAYHEFHRVHDFEHHMLIRFHGEQLTTPGALAMGFTRGRRMPAFGAREQHIAQLALPALHGAARRIALAAASREAGLVGARIAAERGLTSAEARVLTVLLLGCSNQQIAYRLHVSIDTVKTHVQRILRKLGVRSRAQAMAMARP
jgi:DNA-binding CsgD family transcriptional regulator